MGDAIERLFSLIPIAIGVIWVLRFVRRRRSGLSRKTLVDGKKPVAAKASGDTGTAESSEKLRKPAKAAPGIVRYMFGDEKAAPDTGKGPIRKDLDPGSAYRRVKKAEGRPQKSEPAPVPSPPSPLSTERLVTRRIKEPRAETGSSVFERMEALSPLARGILWSQIVGKPKSLEEPEI